MSEFVVLFVTAPSEEVAAAIARTLVRERLVACVNILTGVRSIYRWEETLHDEPEVLMVLKTRADAVDALKSRLPEVHPYACPEMIAIPVVDGLPAYLQWLGDNVGERQKSEE